MKVAVLDEDETVVGHGGFLFHVPRNVTFHQLMKPRTV